MVIILFLRYTAHKRLERRNGDRTIMTNALPVFFAVSRTLINNKVHDDFSFGERNWIRSLTYSFTSSVAATF